MTIAHSSLLVAHLIAKAIIAIVPSFHQPAFHLIKISSSAHVILPTPHSHTTNATREATRAAKMARKGFRMPIMAIEVNVAKTPPAGVKPPYAHDWKVAASVPVQHQQVLAICSHDCLPAMMPPGPKPMERKMVMTTVKVIQKAARTARTSEAASAFGTKDIIERLTWLLQPLNPRRAVLADPFP